MSGRRYSRPAMLLHWLQALLIVWLLWLGWTMIDLPKGAERSAAYGLHKSLGLSALLLVGVRLAWRRYSPPPPSPLPERQARLAELAHWLLYGLLLVVPVAGFLASSFTAYPVKFFGLALPRLLGAPDEGLNALCKNLHVLGIFALLLLLGLHVVAALHHVWRRDGVMLRMLPSICCKNEQLFKNAAAPNTDPSARGRFSGWKL